MRWLRSRRREVAEDFVEDATQKLKEDATKKSMDYLSLIFSISAIATTIVEVATLTGTGNVHAVSNDIPTIVNNGTIYILGGK